MQKLTLPQAAVVGVLNHYQLIEQRIVDTKAQAQQLKRQTAPITLSARQQRKADKDRRRVDRVAKGAVTRKDLKHAFHFDEAAKFDRLSPEFQQGLRILVEAYAKRTG